MGRYNDEPQLPDAGPGGRRTFRLDVRRCLVGSCEGELAEISYYERNNWATFELQCDRCRKKFVVKIEV